MWPAEEELSGNLQAINSIVLAVVAVRSLTSSVQSTHYSVGREKCPSWGGKPWTTTRKVSGIVAQGQVECYYTPCLIVKTEVLGQVCSQARSGRRTLHVEIIRPVLGHDTIPEKNTRARRWAEHVRMAKGRYRWRMHSSQWGRCLHFRRVDRQK